MLDIMYDIPSKGDVDKFVVTKKMVEERNNAELIQLPKKDKAEIA